METSILGALLDSGDAYGRVKNHLTEKEFSPLASMWYTLITEWYKADPHSTKVDRAILKARGERSANDKHKESLVGFFNGIPEGVSADNVIQEVLDLKRRSCGMELAGLLSGGTGGQKQLTRCLGTYNDLLAATSLSGASDLIYAQDSRAVVEAMEEGERLPLFPKALNEKVGGGIFRGDWILLFGQPECGKSLFAINMCAQWLKLGKRILYVANEERISAVKLRIMLSLANMTKEDSEKWPEEFLDRGDKHGVNDRLVAVHVHPGSIPEIEALVKEHTPDVLIVDQLRNVGASGDGATQRLNNVAIEFRQLISRYQLYGMGMAQAAPSDRGGSDKIWLDYSDVEGSRTGLPSQSDVQIGIGADNEMRMHNTRAVSFCRNKVSGDHTGIVVKIDPMRMKVGP